MLLLIYLNIPVVVYLNIISYICTQTDIKINMNTLSVTVKSLRKQFGMTQEELSLKSGVGLRFVRDLEQGKATLRLDKVNQLLDFFNYEMVPQQKQRKDL